MAQVDAQEMLALIQSARDDIDAAVEMMRSDERNTEDDIEYIGEIYHAAVEALVDLDVYARQF